MKATIDQEIIHDVTDAKTQEVKPFLIYFDHHGMTIELPNSHLITLDLSGGVVSVYCADVVGEEGENIRQIPLNPEG